MIFFQYEAKKCALKVFTSWIATRRQDFKLMNCLDFTSVLSGHAPRKGLRRKQKRHKWFQHWFPNGNEKNACCVSKFMSFTVGSYRGREGERSTATVLRAPCRNVIGYKSSFTCHVLLGSYLLSCWVLFKVSISLFLIMILCYLAPAARYSSQFTFHVFFPKAVFGFTQALRRIFRRTEVVVCHIWSSSDLYKQFRNTNGFVSAVWWILSFGTQITSLREQKMSLETDYSSLWLSTVLS